MRGQKSLNSFCLIIKIISSWSWCLMSFFILDLFVSVDSGTTSVTVHLLAMESDLTNFTFTVNSDMWCKHYHNVTIGRDVAAEWIPTWFSCKWQTGEATKWIHLTPSILHQQSDVVVFIIMIYFARTCALSEKRVFGSQPEGLQFMENNIFNSPTFQGSWKILINSFLSTWTLGFRISKGFILIWLMLDEMNSFIFILLIKLSHLYLISNIIYYKSVI